MHHGTPLVSLYLTEGGYGCVGTLGSIQKCITPLCFYYDLLCSSGEAVEFSPVSAPVFQCLQPWGDGLSECPALVQALRGASLLQAMLMQPIHGHSFFWGLFLWIPPSLAQTHSWSCKLRVVWGRVVMVQFFLSEELIVYIWEMLLKVALSIKWKSRPHHLWALLLFLKKKLLCNFEVILTECSWIKVEDCKRTSEGVFIGSLESILLWRVFVLVFSFCFSGCF